MATGGRVGLLGNKDFMETPFSTISYTDTYIQDLQAKDITDVIAATDPSVFSNGLTGTFSENYSIRGFQTSVSDMTVDGLFGMAPYYRASPKCTNVSKCSKARRRCLTACLQAARWAVSSTSSPSAPPTPR